jgi:hypothetical protein
MPSPASLDAIIEKHAIEFAEHVRAAAKNADSEMDVQVEAASQLKAVAKAAGIKLHEAHNHTIAEGRPDSVYNRVIVEYKNPASPSERIGSSLDAAGSKKVVEQIKDRFRALQTELGHSIESLFGVGCDGNRFIFVRWRDKKWEVQPPVEVDQHSTERFLWALFNLGTKGRAFTPEYLARDFGADSALAKTGIRVLYEAILAAKHPKATTFFKQWKILFGEVCGYDIDDPSDKVKKLSSFYGVPGKPHPAELLFAMHTYYAVFMKLLAAGIVARFHGMPGDPVSRLHAATNPAKFKAEMEDLEQGSVFHHFNITNFLEGDLFAWYLPVWSKEIHGFLKAMVERLDGYNPQTLAEEPTVSRDLLKKLYQELFPKSVRHDLGEYYTPDWLAEYVLNEVGYDGNPDKRILDPACGSGTFLVLAINRIRQWYEQHRGEKGVGYEEADLSRKILVNCIGFDLNPLAVMAARTNYLIAIRGLLSGVDRVEIPVYLCDSIVLPKVPGGLMFQDTEAKVRDVPTAVGPLPVAVEVVSPRRVIATYCAILEDCIFQESPFEVFQQRCEADSIPFAEANAHQLLYSRLSRLHGKGEDGVWIRIVKNAFAPVFIGRTVDFLVGNPPWVNYENLPGPYREASASEWDKYNLFPRGGWRARFAKGNTELAMIFVYGCMDTYLREGGSLGFVITQSVFQSKEAGRGFRAFRISADKPIRIRSVDDMTAFKPFEGAVNRTAIVIADLHGRTRYPVPYQIWRKNGEFEARSTLTEVRCSTTRYPASAAPVGDNASPWMVVPNPMLFGTLKKLSRGLCGYRGWKGADTRGGNGIFWLELLSAQRGTLLCRNTPEFSKKKPPQVEWGFEPDLIYPLLRGRETRRWGASPTLLLLFPHRGDRAIPEVELRSDYPKTFGYFSSMRAHLESRRMYDLSRRRLAFYSLFETGQFLKSPYKVVWKYIASDLTCAVVDGHSLKGLANTIVIPDHKLVVVPFKQKKEAHYVCAALNSSIARLLARTYVVGTQISTHILKYIKVPPYDAENEVHAALAELSAECHKAATRDDSVRVSELESQVDATAARLWRITNNELKAIKLLQEAHEPASEDEE